MASVTQPMPGQEALLVEFPGHIQDPDKALARLGGIEAVAGVASGRAQFLGFQFRPGDPLAHPLQGDRRPAKGLLLRISRKAATGAELPGAGGGELSAEVVARVTSAVCFGGLADFHYLSHDARPAHEQACMQQALSGDPGRGAIRLWPEPLLVPPQAWTKQDVPQDYAFRPFYGNDPELWKQGTSTGRVNVGKGRMAAHVINFESVNVVQPLSEPEKETAGLYRDRKEILGAIAALFAQRQIWSAAAVHARFPHVTAPELDMLLSRLAFIFRNGPWKGLWIKRGYDPRTDPAARAHQAMQYSPPGRRAGGAAAAGPSSPAAAAHGPSYQDVVSFRALPPAAGSSPLQLSDLADPFIQALLALAPQPSCSIATGWFSGEQWHQLQARVAARFGTLLGKPAAPILATPMDVNVPNATAGIAPVAPAAAAAQLPPQSSAAVSALAHQAAAMDISGTAGSQPGQQDGAAAAAAGRPPGGSAGVPQGRNQQLMQHSHQEQDGVPAGHTLQGQGTGGSLQEAPDQALGAGMQAMLTDAAGEDFEIYEEDGDAA